MPSKPSKKPTFKETLIIKIDEYMDRAFATLDPEEREKYRTAIRQMEQLLVAISETE